MKLTNEQLLLLDNLAYFRPLLIDENSVYETVQDYIDHIVDDNGKITAKAFADLKKAEEDLGRQAPNATIQPPHELQKIIDIINRPENENLRQLQIVERMHGAAIQYGDLNDPGESSKNLPFLNKEGLAAMALEDGNGNVYIIYRGTDGDYAWSENVDAINKADVPLQMAALEFANKVMYDENGGKRYNNVTVSGHSKGGNMAQYVTILNGDVDYCLNFDGQGFSLEFFEKYRNQIARRAGKIHAINSEYDFVHCLMKQLATDVTYIANEHLFINDTLVITHVPTYVFDDDGNLCSATNQSELAMMINTMTLDIMEVLKNKESEMEIDLFTLGLELMIENGTYTFEGMTTSIELDTTTLKVKYKIEYSKAFLDTMLEDVGRLLSDAMSGELLKPIEINQAGDVGYEMKIRNGFSWKTAIALLSMQKSDDLLPNASALRSVVLDNNVIVSGHSKGGNMAQYVTLRIKQLQNVA